MTQTGSKLSSKLAASVRQAKEQTTTNQEKTNTTTQTKATNTPIIETIAPPIPSRRIWPD